MTRCYEYYCLIVRIPEKCDKGDRCNDYIQKYIKFMKSKGVKFDKSKTDKMLFLRFQRLFGTEGALVQAHNYADRPITPYGENMFHISAKFQDSRKDSFFVVEEGQSLPTLGRRTWFFHEDGREFSLREYARVQEFPDSFRFVGHKEAIKNQIGNAVPPRMAEFVAKKVPPSVSISLFSGAGGMSLGFQRANHKIVLATDWDPYCALTYQNNFPNVPFLLMDIRKITTKELQGQLNDEVNLIFAGPPCQGFSLAGLRFKDDKRNELYKEFLRVVDGLKPRFFVMENVPGILSYEDQVLDDMEKVGYKVTCEMVKGEDIGMRQKRHRVFFVGEA